MDFVIVVYYDFYIIDLQIKKMSFIRDVIDVILICDQRASSSIILLYFFSTIMMMCQER